MKKVLMTLALVLIASGAFAQKEDFAARRAEWTQKRAEQLVKNMKLTDEDEGWFKALYIEYQDSLNALRDALRPETQPEEVNGMREMKQFSDEEAQQMLLNQFNMEEKQVAVKRAYYEKFSTRLTPKQMMLVFMGPAMNRGGQNGQRGGEGFRRGGFGPGFGGPGFGPGRF
ncbi:MAG: hypothetical protein MJZ54_03970 [Bacteroidaceae bacterium]|nr:hypothetical protein [Bacteroidaceae bacterium]